MGIGLSSPSYALDVYDDDSAVPIFGTNSRSSEYNYGVFGKATGSGTHNVGVKGHAESTGEYNYGVIAKAEGEGETNYWLYASASIGDTNWAGWFNGTVNVTGNIYEANISDGTPFYDGDALSDLSKISGKNGKIDHSTLPEFAHTEIEVPINTNLRNGKNRNVSIFNG